MLKRFLLWLPRWQNLALIAIIAIGVQVASIIIFVFTSNPYSTDSSLYASSVIVRSIVEALDFILTIVFLISFIGALVSASIRRGDNHLGVNKAGLAVSSIIVLLIITAGFILQDLAVQTPGEKQALYEKAKKKCPQELWLITNDIGPILSDSLRPPYPAKVDDVASDILLDYACNREQAQKKANGD